MNFDVLLEVRNRKPFSPVQIQLKNGEQHLVTHPECLIVGRNTSLILRRDPENPKLAEDWVRIANLHVTHIRLLQSA